MRWTRGRQREQQAASETGKDQELAGAMTPHTAGLTDDPGATWEAYLSEEFGVKADPAPGEAGVTHTGPGTLNITGSAIGTNPGEPGHGTVSTTQTVARANPGDPYVQNLGRGQINIRDSVVGPGADLDIRYERVAEPGDGTGADLEAG